jgi:hypothetical protein
MMTRPFLSPLNVAISGVIGGVIFIAILLLPIVKHHVRRHGNV